VPDGYPRDLECDLNLSDGRKVFVRPIVPADIDALRAAIANADPQTIHDRFLGGRPPTDETALRRLTTVDYVYRLALAAVAPDGSGIAIARYEGKADSDLAEVAVVVDPAWRRVGLASGLLRMLASAALERGIHRFTAISYADNIDVQDILARSGLPLRQSGTSGVIDTSVELGAKSEPIDAGQSEITDPGA
jgi:GNAT superfamily N-acetyltransferase